MTKKNQVFSKFIWYFLILLLGLSIGVFGTRLYAKFFASQHVIVHNASGSDKSIELVIKDPVALKLKNDSTIKIDITNRFQEGGLSIKVDGVSHQIDTYLTYFDMDIIIVLMEDGKMVYFEP